LAASEDNHPFAIIREAYMASKITTFAIAAATALALIAPASADLEPMLGDWNNVSPNTRGIVRISIVDADGAIEVHVWARCHPYLCDWGAVKATPYGADVDASLPAHAEYLQADFTTSFSTTTLVIGPAPVGPNGELRAITLGRFTDGSRRSAYAYPMAFRH
jgi:hypothetical protein